MMVINRGKDSPVRTIHTEVTITLPAGPVNGRVISYFVPNGDGFPS